MREKGDRHLSSGVVTPCPVCPVCPVCPAPPLDTLGEPVAAWVRLLDAVEAAHRATSCFEADAARTVSARFEALYAALHQLTPDERVVAREYLWLRDRPAEPLPASPDERGWWADCPCRSCRAERLAAFVQRQVADLAPDAQRQYLRVAAPQLARARSPFNA